MSVNVLKVENLSKSYNNKTIIRDISFEVNSGEIFGIVGTNDSGKTTLMQIICGNILPSCGEISICGKSITDDFENAIINLGACFENSKLYTNMTGIQNLKYYSKLYPKIPNITKRLESLIKLVDLEDVIYTYVKNYTKDQLQKLVIAQSLLHFPKILVIDELSSKLDKENVSSMRKFLKNIVKQYRIGILIISNNLSDMEVLCDRIAVMSDGEILDIKTSEEIQRGIKFGKKVEIKVNYPNYGAKLIKQNFNLNPRAIGPYIYIKMEEDEVASITSLLLNNNIAVFGIKTIYLTFEQIYMGIINRNKYSKSQLR